MISQKLILAPNLALPWSSELEDNKRYWKIFFGLFIPFVVLGPSLNDISQCVNPMAHKNYVHRAP